MDASLIIRPASPAELDELIAIDDDAGALFARAGIEVDLAPEHPFARAEQERWLAAARAGHAFLAAPPGEPAVAMLVMGRVDGLPYLDELAVRTSAMRRGIGSRLVAHAVAWAAGEPLWLTTYAHLAWNRPFYERAQFAVVAEPRCPRGIVAILAEQRRWLPAPGERVAMRRPPLT